MKKTNVLFVASDGYLPQARAILAGLDRGKPRMDRVGDVKVVDNVKEARDHLPDYDVICLATSAHESPQSRRIVETSGLARDLSANHVVILVAGSHESVLGVNPLAKHRKMVYVPGTMRDELTSPTGVYDLLGHATYRPEDHPTHGTPGVKGSDSLAMVIPA